MSWLVAFVIFFIWGVVREGPVMLLALLAIPACILADWLESKWKARKK